MTDPREGLVSELVLLRQCLVECPLPLDTSAAAPARTRRQDVLAQLDDYILPRLVQLEAPLLAVVGGSTGAGKSTLVNSLVGRAVSPTGALRPTTRSAVLVHHPSDEHWFGADRLLPELPRVEAASNEPGTLRLLPVETIRPGFALLDTPDIDSVERTNRELATQLLGAADLWLFVTSAARYADQVPWDYLEAAVARTAAVAIVLDRVPPEAVGEVRDHLAAMCRARGLGDAPLFTVLESSQPQDDMLAAEEVAPVRQWLDELTADSAAGAAVVRRTLDGAIGSLTPRLEPVAAEYDEQERVLVNLRGAVDTAYGESMSALEAATLDGTLLRGEVLARWQEFVGTGELFRGLEERVGRIRDRLRAAASGGRPPAEPVGVALENSLQTLIVEYAERASEHAAATWRASPAGSALLAGAPTDLGRASRDLSVHSDRTIREWQGGVLDLVRSEGAGRRTTARALAYGVNGLGIALMMTIFATTAGITGAEIGVAGGTALVAQKVLEAAFGDQAVRRLAEQARIDLHDRVDALWATDRARFEDLLAAQPVSAGAARRLRARCRQVDRRLDGSAVSSLLARLR